jgi:hypothetical protein
MPTSLTSTIDSLNSAFFFGEPMGDKERHDAALYIASWQGKPHAYRGMFGMPTTELAQPLRLFTGETVTSGAAKCHIVGEEACRALWLLKSDDPTVQSAFAKARDAFQAMYASPEVWLKQKGMYCCGTCSAALWRHLAVSDFDFALPALEAGMESLKLHRKDGRYRRFPFYYTVLALSEIDLPAARAELRYLAPACERSLHNPGRLEPYARRKQVLMERALALV